MMVLIVLHTSACNLTEFEYFITIKFEFFPNKIITVNFFLLLHLVNSYL